MRLHNESWLCQILAGCLVAVLFLGCTEGRDGPEDGVMDGGSGENISELGDTLGIEDESVEISTGDAEVDMVSVPDPTAWHESCPIEEREQRLIDVGEVTLNVACRGAGPTLVFLHGFPEFHYGWNKVMDELATEFRLVAPDQRGYNLSDKPEAIEAYALPLLVEDILTLLPLISPDPVILVAHDWGGPVGWLVAHTPDAHLRGFVSTNGPHPMRFAELIANDPEQQAASAYMGIFRSPLGEQMMTADSLTAQFSGILSEEEMSIYQEAWSQPGAITGGLNWYRANDLDPEAVGPIFANYAPTLSVPAVVMWGLDDEFVLAMNAEGLESYAPDLEVLTYEGVDHWIAHHIPEEIAEVIRALDLKTSLP
jgi:pimeloyl-ACP methyl ester carboxylesterase